jgi:hypothetical protein
MYSVDNYSFPCKIYFRPVFHRSIHNNPNFSELFMRMAASRVNKLKISGVANPRALDLFKTGFVSLVEHKAEGIPMVEIG